MCILLVFTETFLLARILYINPLQFQSHFFDRRAELTPRTLLHRAQVWGFVKRWPAAVSGQTCCRCWLLLCNQSPHPGPTNGQFYLFPVRSKRCSNPIFIYFNLSEFAWPAFSTSACLTVTDRRKGSGVWGSACSENRKGTWCYIVKT